jgi:hypothetical protein
LQKWGGQPLKKDSLDTTDNMVCNFKSIGFVAVRNFLVLTLTDIAFLKCSFFLLKAYFFVLLWGKKG